MEQLDSKKYGKLVAKCWADPAFKKLLKEHPEKALKEFGVNVPKDFNIKVIEDTETTKHLVIAEHDSFGERELKNIAAGTTCCCSC